MELGLSKYILDLARERGFKKFTEPQLKAFTPILEGENTLIIAPTGSGKTEAAFLPILQLMIANPGEPIRTVYITPLRALNRDLIDRLMWWANKLDLKISVRHGDTPQRERRIQSEAPPDILITTPETFSFLLNTRIMGKHLRNVQWLIIDEIHELVSSKRGVQLSIALERLRSLNKKLQVIGLSATVGEPEKILEFIAGGRKGVIVHSELAKKIEIEVDYPKPTQDDIVKSEELLTYPDVVARLRIIDKYVQKHKSTLIFTNTRPMAEILGNRLLLYNDKLSIMVHHGSLSSVIRTRIERMLKEGLLKGIVCTSSLELGIDVGDIDFVIQYGSPRQASKLLQRVGRSGHWIERTSKGLIIAIDPDDAIELLVIKERALRGKLERVLILKKPLDVLIHEIIGMLISLRRIDIEELLNILRRSIYYKDITRNEILDLLTFQQDIMRNLLILGEKEIIKKRRYKDRIYKYYFSNLSMIPETIQYYVVNDEDNTLVGVLDEKFISLYGEIGTKFIMAGRVWRIIQIYEDKIFVKPERDPFGAVPDWVGEEIPVPYEVAMEVGRLKRIFIEKMGKEGYQYAIEELSREYKVDRDYLEEALKHYYETYKSVNIIPFDKLVVIEREGDKIVIDIHGGTLVNRTLASFIAYEIYDRYGERVRFSSNQYRIFIDNYNLESEKIINILKSPESLTNVFREIVTSSNIFKWRFIHVARRMGIIEKEKKITQREASELINLLRDTPVYEETFRETISRDFDIERTLELLKMIRDGEIEIKLVDGFLKITNEYMRRHEPKYEVRDRRRIEALEILSYKTKILNKYVVLVCMDCLSYIDEVKIAEVDDIMKCPNCGSTRLGFSEESFEKVIEAVDIYKRRKKKYRNKILRQLLNSSKIIEKYGKVGLFVLASDNITYKDANEILKIEDKLSDKLIKLIIERGRINLLRKTLHH